METSGFRGRPVVIKFFAEDCARCDDTLPATQALYSSMTDVVFIGVAENESEVAARKLVRKHELKFPVVADTDSRIAARFEIHDVPTTFVSDNQGLIRWVGGPEHSSDDIEAAIDSVRN